MVRVTFCGAAGVVTGSGYLVESRLARVLVDFGTCQGRDATVQNNHSLGRLDSRRLDAVVLTHAYLVHCGRLPIRCRTGCRARIHATPASADFVQILLEDAGRIQVAVEERLNLSTVRQGKPPVELLYTLEGRLRDGSWACITAAGLRVAFLRGRDSLGQLRKMTTRNTQ
jgi:metallo-beta-lactamase family protein